MSTKPKPKLKTLPSLFATRIAESGNEPCVFVRREGVYVGTDWNEFASDVRSLAAGLVNLGIRPGDRIAQFSENRYEWLVVDLAIQLAQAVHVPIHAPLTGEQAAYQIDHSGAAVVFVSMSAQADKLASLKRDWPAAVQFFSFEKYSGQFGGRPVAEWRTLQHGITEQAMRDVERQSVENVGPESLATILYTSGTTGEPKGVMLTQNNLMSNTLAAVEQFGMSAGDRRLTFLPMSHIFARTCDVYTWLVTGCQLALADRKSVV